VRRESHSPHAARRGSPPSSGGTVARVIAEFNDDKLTQRLPFPHSHGIAIQFIDDPESPTNNPNGLPLVDVDTCDQATNPTCGPMNYPPCNPDGTPIPPATECNKARATYCVAYPTAAICRPVASLSYVTDNAEILTYYDGGAPIFALYNQSNPRGGINLTYAGALAFADDQFQCGGIEPTTGLPPTRSVNLYIACNSSEPGLAVSSYTERGSCQYYITAYSAKACSGEPSPSSAPPMPSPPP